MATVERRNGRFRLIFYLTGKRYSASLKTADPREADAIAGSAERALMLLQQGVLTVPEGADLATFVLSGGKLAERPKPPPALRLGELCDRYLRAHELGAMEENSLDTVRMHLRHFAKTLGAGFSAQALELSHVQQHIDRRARQKGARGRPLSPTTLRKEVTSVRACWNWGVQAGLVGRPFPANKALKYPKGDEKPPFQTWAEIERQLARGGLSQEEERDLWDCLFLTLPEVEELLAFVQGHAAHPWVYPMFCLAAHTGARRSELLRARVQDLDFEGETVLLREAKRARGRRTTRRVPMSPFLAGALKDWLAEHPGGPHLFCQADLVGRSKKRGRTTGHKGEATRASSLRGRLAAVRVRDRPGVLPLTRDEAHDHFRRTLAGSRWSVLRGWHVLRHSFCSNCAARGVDQRLINAWVGHQTEEMVRRYRHLIPDQQRAAIRSVFGGQ